MVDAESPLRSGAHPSPCRDVTSIIATNHPDDVQIRLDLAKCHHNLGEVLIAKGDAKQATESFLRARETAEALTKESPRVPRYSGLLATTLASLGFAYQGVDPPKVEETYRAAIRLFRKTGR